MENLATPTAVDKFPFFSPARFVGVSEQSPFGRAAARRLSSSRRVIESPAANGGNTGGDSATGGAANGGTPSSTECEVRLKPLRNGGVHHAGFPKEGQKDSAETTPTRVVRGKEKYATYAEFYRKNTIPKDPARETFATPAGNARKKTTFAIPGGTPTQPAASPKKAFMWAARRLSAWSLKLPVDAKEQYDPDKYLPYCVRGGNYLRLSVAEMAGLPMLELQEVEGFTIGRVGSGEVTWDEPVDVGVLNVDRIIEIDRGEVAVFPELGADQLGGPATVQLTGMLKKNEKGVNSVDAIAKYIKKKLLQFCEGNRLEFVDICAKAREGTFKVPGF